MTTPLTDETQDGSVSLILLLFSQRSPKSKQQLCPVQTAVDGHLTKSARSLPGQSQPSEGPGSASNYEQPGWSMRDLHGLNRQKSRRQQWEEQERAFQAEGTEARSSGGRRDPPAGGSGRSKGLQGQCREDRQSGVGMRQIAWGSQAVSGA